MKLDKISEIYNLIASGIENNPSRTETIGVRKTALQNVLSTNIVKMAFDTRRVNQETDYIPRRGLQNYHRSEKFVSDDIAIKIRSFGKLATILNQLKLEYGKQPEWQDSYTRVLASAIDKGLRKQQLDGDFSDSQPSMASLAYLEELMYVRYRLTADDLANKSDLELRTAILGKDEILVSIGTNYSPVDEIKIGDVSKYSYDQMMDKMLVTISQVIANQKPAQADDNLTNKLFDVKATKDSPEIERTVTITIKDKIVDKIEKTAVVPVAENTKVATEEFDEESIDELME